MSLLDAPAVVSSRHEMTVLQGGDYWLIACACGWISDGHADRWEALRIGGRHAQDMRRTQSD